MRLVKPPTVPYKYTELYLGMHSDSFHPELEMKLVTQKAVDGNTSAWSSRGCPAVTYVGTGAFASQRTFKTCTKSNSITTASNFRYDKITLAEPLSLLLRPSPHSPHLFFLLSCTHSHTGAPTTVVYDAAIFIGVAVTDETATDVNIAILPRATEATDCWPYYQVEGGSDGSGSVGYHGARVAIGLGGSPAICL